MDHEHTEHVHADADRLYQAIADPENLPRFVPQVTGIQRQDGGERVEVEARYSGKAEHGGAYFRTDDASRRIEWGADSGYHGWMQVDPDSDGSRLTLFLHTVHDAEEEYDVSGTLDAIRRLAEAEV